MDAALTNKQNLMSANLNPNYYLSSEGTSTNHDIFFLAGLMTISSLVVLAFLLLRFSHTYFSTSNLSPVTQEQSQDQNNVTYSDTFV